MHQCRNLQRCAGALAIQAGSGNSLQLRIHQGKQLIECRAITSPPPMEQARDFMPLHTTTTGRF